MRIHPTRNTGAIRAAMLALACAAVAAAWPGAASADNSDGQGWDAVFALLPPSPGSGATNGAARLVPAGNGKYQVEYDRPLAADNGLARPGAPAVIGNSDGNPVIERNPAIRPQLATR